MLRGGREPRDSGHDKEDHSRDCNHNIGQRSYFGVANEIMNGPNEGICKSQQQNRGADKNERDEDEESVPGADSAQPEEKEPANRPTNAEPQNQFYGWGRSHFPFTIRTCRAGGRVFGPTPGALSGWNPRSRLRVRQ